MFRRLQLATVIVSLLLVTSGCMKMDMDLTVNKNDTVSGSVIIAFSNDALDLAKSMGSESALNTDSLITEEPGVKVEPFKDDNYQGSKLTFEERPFDEFSTGTNADSLKFSRDGNIISVTGAIDMAGEDPSMIDQIRTNPITAGLFAKSDISVSITLPGTITSSTGVISGNTVTFKGGLGDNIQIDVQADDSVSLDPFVIGAGMLLLAAAVVGGVVLLNRRKTAVQTESSPQSQDNEW